LALIWLGHSVAALRKIRGESIGAERGPSHVPDNLAIEIVDAIRADATAPERLPERVILRYADDLCAFVNQARRVLKPSGKIVAVVGNSAIRGNYIPNAHILALALRGAGFTISSQRERPLPDNRRYMPIGAESDSHGLARRMRSEVVLEARKDMV